MYRGTKISPEERRSPRQLGKFDNRGFIKNIQGPRNWMIVFVILGFAISTGVFIITSKPERYCGDWSPFLCRKCPEYATCDGRNATCAKGLILFESFCVFPDSTEFRALQILPAIRALGRSELTPQSVADALSVSQLIAKKAIAYSKQEPWPLLRDVQRYASFVCTVVFLILFLYCAWARLRAMSDQRSIRRIVQYLEHSRPEPRTISSIFTTLGLPGRTPVRRRILNELGQMPQFDVRRDSGHVARTM
jgi:hypothetical protein